jgi:hypothetical protein
MREWLYFPPDFMPGTKMPTFWGLRQVFHGKRDDHIEPAERAEVDALVQYLRHMSAVDLAAAGEREAGGRASGSREARAGGGGGR